MQYKIYGDSTTSLEFQGNISITNILVILDALKSRRYFISLASRFSFSFKRTWIVGKHSYSYFVGHFPVINLCFFNAHICGFHQKLF